jgi:hypothetical protein
MAFFSDAVGYFDNVVDYVLDNEWIILVIPMVLVLLGVRMIGERT